MVVKILNLFLGILTVVSSKCVENAPTSRTMKTTNIAEDLAEDFAKGRQIVSVNWLKSPDPFPCCMLFSLMLIFISNFYLPLLQDSQLVVSYPCLVSVKTNSTGRKFEDFIKWGISVSEQFGSFLVQNWQQRRKVHEPGRCSGGVVIEFLSADVLGEIRGNRN